MAREQASLTRNNSAVFPMSLKKHIQEFLNLLLGHGPRHLPRRAVDARDHRVREPPLGVAIVVGFDHNGLAAREPSLQDDDDLAALDNAHGGDLR